MTICHSIADFRQNILSLDDLASGISEMAELKQQVSRNFTHLPSFDGGWRL